MFVVTGTFEGHAATIRWEPGRLVDAGDTPGVAALLTDEVAIAREVSIGAGDSRSGMGILDSDIICYLWLDRILDGMRFIDGIQPGVPEVPDDAVA